MNAGHRILGIVPNVHKGRFILSTDCRSKPSALFAQKADAFGSAEPSTHHLRLHAVPFPCGNEIVAELNHIDNCELYAFRQADCARRLTAGGDAGVPNIGILEFLAAVRER